MTSKQTEHVYFHTSLKIILLAFLTAERGSVWGEREHDNKRPWLEYFGLIFHFKMPNDHKVDQLCGLSADSKQNTFFRFLKYMGGGKKRILKMPLWPLGN